MKKTIVLIVANLLLLQLNFTFAQTVETIVGTTVAASYPALGAAPNGDGAGTSINIYPGSGAICSDASNNIYFIDRHGKYIRKWNAATHQVTTIAGTGAALPPSGSYALINTGTLPGDGDVATNLNIAASTICVTADGNYLYFAEGAYETLRVINLTTGIVSTVCGYNSGPAGGAPYCSVDVVNDNLAARFARVATTSEHSLTLDENNNLYIADRISSRRIRKIFRNPVTGIADGNSAITTLAYGAGGVESATDGVSGYASISTSGASACVQPPGFGYLGSNSGGVDLMYRNNHLYFTEYGNTTIGGVSYYVLRFRKMNLSTLRITTIHNEISSSYASIPSINTTSLAMDNLDNMYVTDAHNSAIFKVTQAGVSSVFLTPNYIVMGSAGPYSAGTNLSNVGPHFSSGCGITNDDNGNLIYVDAGNYTINKITLCANPIEPITGPSSICIGQTISLANATAGGIWSSIAGRATIDAVGNVTGISEGAAQIRYTVAAMPIGCRNYVTRIVQVSSLPNIPTIRYAPGALNPQCVGLALRVNRTFDIDGNPSPGTWTSTGVVTLTQISPNRARVSTGAVAGAFSVTYRYTNASGCSNSRTIGGTVINCPFKGINTNQVASSNEQLVIYPNPAKTTININIATLIGNGSIVLTDLYGKQIKQQVLSIGINSIDVSSFAKGMYLVSVITNDQKSTQKIIVE